MKVRPLLLFIGIAAISLSFVSFTLNQNHNPDMKTEDPVLRHIVLFKFKEGTTTEQVQDFEKAFAALENKIPEVRSFEWGLNNSPEGLEKGFTHCFLITFHSEKDRDVYLPHPDHQEFVALIGPSVEDVLVVDYWSH